MIWALALLARAHTDIWLKGEDLGMLLLLCPDVSFFALMEQKFSYLGHDIWLLSRTQSSG
jgi:hypothetical protein